MRVILILPMLLLTLSAAASSKWESVAKSNSNDIFFIDSNSYQKSGDSITFWQRDDFAERDNKGNLSSKIQYTINCRTREVIGRYLMTYDDKDNTGRLTSSFKMNDSWRPIAPDTVSWIIMNHVCK